MQCRTCGYILLNLPEPRCPECGTGFDIRSYRFVPGTVAFACPHCGHMHGGTGESYLPAMTELAACLGCGQAMRVGAMRVVPLSDRVEDYSTDRVPWEERKQLGRWRAFWRTWLLGAVGPQELGPMVAGPGGRFGAALGFAMLVNGLAFAAFGLSWALAMGLLFAAIGSQSSRGGGPGWEEILGIVGCMGGVPTLFGLLWPLLLTVIHASSAHLLLLITGVRAGGFNITARVLLYCQAPALFVAVPFCGVPYVWAAAYLWTCICAAIALMSAHRIDAWRAILASFAAPVTVFLLVAGLYGAAIFWSVRYAPPANHTPVTIHQPVVPVSPVP